MQALVDLYQVFCAGIEFAGAAGGESAVSGPTGRARRESSKRRRKFCSAIRAR